MQTMATVEGHTVLVLKA